MPVVQKVVKKIRSSGARCSNQGIPVNDAPTCGICWDSLKELDPEERERGQPIAMTCGHVYHGLCLSSYQTSMQLGVDDLPCPKCKKAKKDFAGVDLSALEFRGWSAHRLGH